MMMSPETYHEEYLKGKTTEQIQTIIRSLKRQIGHLKIVMENPYYPGNNGICPDASAQIQCNRMYLERAKQALIDAGGAYKPSRAEKAAVDFGANIPAIKVFKFRIDSCRGFWDTYTVTIEGEALSRSVTDFYTLMMAPDSIIPAEDWMTKDAFLTAIREMHMGEWRHDYDTDRFGWTVLDGTEWDIEITYNNGHKPVYFFGANSYPYNFDALKSLFGIDECPDEEVE